MCKHLLKIQRLILALLIFGGGIFYTSSATARVCFLPDSTDCGEGDVDVPEVQITCATYGGYETEAACLEARTNKTAQTCTLNSGCYYPKCAYDSERKCKNENPNKNCLSQDVDGVKCWYSQLKTCFDQGYKSACSSDENSTPVNIEAFDGPCYKCTEKATCKQMKPGVYYGPNDTCPKYTDRKDAGVSARDGKCSTCEPQACSAINTAYKSEAKKDTCGSNKEAKKVEGTDSAADGPCYKCVDKPVSCTYEYRQATTADSCGLRDFENTTKCMDTINGCMCYTQLQKVSSVDTGGAGRVTPYNKISNKSATCVDEKGVTRYQTICQGTRKSSCDTRAGYEFKPNGCVSDTYNNGFEVKGDEWGDCVKTECNYEYVHLTKNDTGTDNYDKQRLRYGEDGEICNTEGSTREQTSSCIYSCSNGSCKCGSKSGPVCSPAGSSCKIKQTCHIYRDCQYGTKCYNAIINNPSVTGRLSGTPEWGTIYNKISNNSASCVANGVRKYETLCEGTIREKCQGNQTFEPNGCVSNIYSDGGVYVSGAIWGNCVCSADKGFYDTVEKCKKMTGKNCTHYHSCYQTCESQGYYSTQEACLTGKNTRQQCIEKYGCYVRKAVGFTITQNSPNACGGWSFYLIDADGNYVNGDGIHEAGNYSVVITGSGRLISHANVSSRQSGGGWCFGDQAENKGCEKTKLTGINRSESKAHSFQDGMDYTISVNCL